MNTRILNSKVKTPIGDGVCQGRYAVRDANGETVVESVLVRIRMNPENQHLLGSSNCMTPRAMASALFVFNESELL
jgi:hypothetical protein